MNAPRLEPMFGSDWEFTPAKVADAIELVRKGKRCHGCGSGPKPESSLCCMYCHRVAPDKEGAVARHTLPAIGHNRMSARQVARARKEAKAARVTAKPIRLTKAQLRELVAEYGAKEIDPGNADVAAWLASQAARQGAPTKPRRGLRKAVRVAIPLLTA